MRLKDFEIRIRCLSLRQKVLICTLNALFNADWGAGSQGLRLGSTEELWSIAVWAARMESQGTIKHHYFGNQLSKCAHCELLFTANADQRTGRTLHERLEVVLIEIHQGDARICQVIAVEKTLALIC